MHLRSLTLKGFKSFPDRTKLEFDPGVSVIVGPNGSGKSNVTDAVLWAMGEQSPLAVRGQSMQDVIFAGAHGVQARSEAEVEVVLDNGDGAVDLPAGEVSIARRLDRAGEGVYPLEQVAPVPRPLLPRYFLRGTGPRNGLVRVKPAVRSLVTFRRINFLEEPWPIRARFDVIRRHIDGALVHARRRAQIGQLLRNAPVHEACFRIVR